MKRLREIDCQAHSASAKCSAIKSALRPYNYDVHAWQLAHSHRMFQIRPELFEQPESRGRWLRATETKIEQTKSKLEEVKNSGEDKNKKIKRLEQKLQILELIKKNMEDRSVFEDSLERGVRWYDKFKEDKQIQTGLTSEQVKTALEVQEQVKILAKK